MKDFLSEMIDKSMGWSIFLFLGNIISEFSKIHFDNLISKFAQIYIIETTQFLNKVIDFEIDSETK